MGQEVEWGRRSGGMVGWRWEREEGEKVKRGGGCGEGKVREEGWGGGGMGRNRVLEKEGWMRRGSS